MRLCKHLSLCVSVTFVRYKPWRRWREKGDAKKSNYSTLSGRMGEAESTAGISAFPLSSQKADVGPKHGNSIISEETLGVYKASSLFY